ncbi:PAQR family membrane homeostasis protein TrhA [Microbaculum marinum]|uniref:Hemolysin III family protein n=1 Tax=Microbaculum marinum TaxID=1764581 RepID=A0AAW9RH99_9HYPH
MDADEHSTEPTAPPGRGLRERMRAARFELRRYSRAERVADGVIHGLGVTASLVAVAVLLVMALPTGETRLIAATAIYGAGMLATFSLSAAYNIVGDNGLGGERATMVLRRLDHAAIYLMIAGTYTPFTLIGLDGHGGRLFGVALLHWLLALVWLVALVGIVLKLVWPRRFRALSLVLYLTMGWIGLLAGGAILAALPPAAVVLLAVGGVLYTAGVVFHLWTSLSFQNAIWHGFVLAAAGCHYAAIVAMVGTA